MKDVLNLRKNYVSRNKLNGGPRWVSNNNSKVVGILLRDKPSGMLVNMTSRRLTSNKDMANNEWASGDILPQVERGVPIRDIVRKTYGRQSD